MPEKCGCKFIDGTVVSMCNFHWIDMHDDYDYRLKGGNLKVKVTACEDWDIKAIRSDNGKEDSFPIMYFQDNFKKINA